MSGILDRKAVEEFRAIWLDEYGELLPFDRAEMEAETFLHTFRLLFYPNTTALATPSPALDDMAEEMRK